MRDNVYLTAGLHGMTRSQIDAKFDEIIDFADIGDFLDTPYKHLSSGMKVRIAFAVISQLEEPILLVDEVLAVGDKAFREKCYKRIDELLAGGRTLFFVSHNERDLRRFCTRGLYLDKGALVLDAPIDEVLDRYNADHGTSAVAHFSATRKGRAADASTGGSPVVSRIIATWPTASTRSPRWAATTPREQQPRRRQAGPQPASTAQPGSAPHADDGRAHGVERGIDLALSMQRPVVVAHLRSIRRRVPNASPDQLIRILERRYLTAVTTGGAAVGATAVIPGIGTGVTLALSGVETAGFLEATALFAQSVAEVHGIPVDNPERARALVMTLMLGQEGSDLVRQFAGQATGSRRRAQRLLGRARDQHPAEGGDGPRRRTPAQRLHQAVRSARRCGHHRQGDPVRHRRGHRRHRQQRARSAGARAVAARVRRSRR